MLYDLRRMVVGNCWLGHMCPKTTAISRLTETTQLNTRRIINHLIDELDLKGDDQ
ncbi:hypothetical protein ACTL6P_24825 [Endozoicomonas acroporae]|uniref:hypothetical protein n=1 Tax=Endozoicomonas acroporae TaxID=1701104 RepID=UPI0015E0A8CF|nr:hypothetical protein [Endozoicomonas acroporae]